MNHDEPIGQAIHLEHHIGKPVARIGAAKPVGIALVVKSATTYYHITTLAFFYLLCPILKYIHTQRAVQINPNYYIQQSPVGPERVCSFCLVALCNFSCFVKLQPYDGKAERFDFASSVKSVSCAVLLADHFSFKPTWRGVQVTLCHYHIV